MLPCCARVCYRDGGKAKRELVGGRNKKVGSCTVAHMWVWIFACTVRIMIGVAAGRDEQAVVLRQNAASNCCTTV